VLSFCRYWHISPRELERIDPWLRERMVDYAVRQQADEKREAKRAARRG
jgi:hypothetical protein